MEGGGMWLWTAIGLLVVVLLVVLINKVSKK
jgi:heme exporter protein D